MGKDQPYTSLFGGYTLRARSEATMPAKYLREWRLTAAGGRLTDSAAVNGQKSPVRRESWLVIAWVPCYYATMIRSFKNTATEDIFNGKNSRAARKTCPRSLWRVAARKLDQLDSVESLDELRVPPGNRLEALAGDRKRAT